MKSKIGLVLAVFLASEVSEASTLDRQRAAIKSLEGCFLVDYSYSEIEALSEDYELDPRVYDGSSRFTVKEWIKAVEETDTRIRLQHFMMAEDANGNSVFQMRHHGEIWEYEAPFLFDYQGRFSKTNDRWNPLVLEGQDYWVRKITNLDDGIRYECRGQWNTVFAYPEFSCDSYAPIPGRETRDMGRTDYNTLERSTKVIAYPGSWLERQDNRKVVFDDSDGSKTPLAREVGKHWYVRQDASACETLSDWVEERQPFWDVLADVWNGYLTGESDFHEVRRVDGSTRYHKVSKLFNEYYPTVATNQEHESLVRSQLATIIESHRE